MALQGVAFSRTGQAMGEPLAGSMKMRVAQFLPYDFPGSTLAITLEERRFSAACIVESVRL